MSTQMQRLVLMLMAAGRGWTIQYQYSVFRLMID